MAMDRPSCLIAALLALYVEAPGAAMSAITEPMRMIRPPVPCAAMRWAAH